MRYGHLFRGLAAYLRGTALAAPAGAGLGCSGGQVDRDREGPAWAAACAAGGVEAPVDKSEGLVV